MSQRRALIVLGAVALALGGCSFGYGFTRLPMRWLVRGHVGDVAAAAFVYALVGLVVRAPIAVRAGIVVAIVVVVELGQGYGHARPGTAGELVLGAHFDPWDFAAYALGLAAAIVCERRAAAGRAAAT